MTASLSLLITALVLLLLNSGLTTRNEDNEAVSARSASQLFNQYCVSCHGRDGKAQTKKGKLNHSRDITDPKWQDDVSDERIFNSIMNGRNVRGTMPAFNKKISEQEADSLVTFVRSLKK